MAKKRGRPQLSKDVLSETYAAYVEHGADGAAQLLGMEESGVYRRIKKYLDRYGIPTAQPTAEAVVPEEDVLRERVRSLEARLRTTTKGTLNDEYVKRIIVQLAEQDMTPPGWLLRTGDTPDAEPGIPVMIWSDWHLGETVRPEEINGVNEFDLSIAEERVQRLVKTTVSLLKNYTVHTSPYPGIVVCLGGDMVAGDIHEELRETNERPTMAVVVEAVRILTWAIKQLADQFGRVFVPCVAGNHGRTSHKPRHSGRNWTNYDWLIYQFLSKAFDGDDRVKFLIGEGADVLFSVYGHRYLLTHGDNLAKGGDGQIGHFGPVIRGSQRRQVRNQAVNQEFDTLVCGHFHSLTMTPRFIVNGSLVGPGAFSHNLAFGFEKPQQALWLSHRTKGVTICMPVFLADGNPYKGRETEWISWIGGQ